jgi:peptidoglycan/LPS O-acetylase OafA/YrhL
MLATSIAALVVLLTLVGIDVWFAVDSVPKNTWSEVIAYWGSRFALIPFAWGVLAGHFFHPAMPHLSSPTGIVVLCWAALVMEICSLAFAAPPLAYLLAGLVCGLLCWQV